MSNKACKRCSFAHNAINGRYCDELQRYVEHAETPACEWANLTSNK